MPDATTTAPSSQESPARWVSVAQASAALNVSEKTLLRRIKAGQIEARKEPLAAGGMAWRVHLDSSAMDIAPDNGKDIAPEPQRTKTERAGTVPEGERTKNGRDGHAKDSAMDNAPEVSIARAGTAKDTQRTEESDDLLAHLKEENRFLRGLVEQRDRDAAELRAALREALKAMPKALTEGTATAPEAPISFAISADGVAHTEPVKAAQIAVKRDARPLWKVVLGIR
jgi:hypothetical protein